MLLVLQGGATVDRVEGLGSNGEPLATIRLDGGGC
jgi:hypothetical protein